MNEGIMFLVALCLMVLLPQARCWLCVWRWLLLICLPLRQPFMTSLLPETSFMDSIWQRKKYVFSLISFRRYFHVTMCRSKHSLHPVPKRIQWSKDGWVLTAFVQPPFPLLEIGLASPFRSQRPTNCSMPISPSSEIKPPGTKRFELYPIPFQPI